MKKVLIISYFYPPANFVGAQRTSAWAKYLHEYGYYPIIITRQWNEGQADLIDKQDNNQLEVEYNKTHEVHRLPYKRNLRDRLSNYPFLKFLQKTLTFKELILSNWRIKSLPYSNFYAYSKSLIYNNPDIKIMIASGRPFQSFSIGHQLKKEFPKLHWIPDYRDEWSTRKSNIINSTLERWLKLLEERSELKWTSDSTCFLTVSEVCSNNISKFINKQGISISNGFDGDITTQNSHKNNFNGDLKLLYLGSLYSYQDFTFLFESIQNINTHPTNSKILLTFLGSFSNEKEYTSLKNKTKKLDPRVRLVNKVPHEEVKDYIQQADILFLTEYINLEGCLPVKIFDYYNSSKPILLCPSDNGLMESFIKETESGYIVNTKEECKIILKNLLYKKKLGEALIGPRNTKNAYFYTRKHQTKRLASALDELLEKDRRK